MRMVVFFLKESTQSNTLCTEILYMRKADISKTRNSEDLGKVAIISPTTQSSTFLSVAMFQPTVKFFNLSNTLDTFEMSICIIRRLTLPIELSHIHIFLFTFLVHYLHIVMYYKTKGNKIPPTDARVKTSISINSYNILSDEMYSL